MVIVGEFFFPWSGKVRFSHDNLRWNDVGGDLGREGNEGWAEGKISEGRDRT